MASEYKVGAVYNSSMVTAIKLLLVFYTSLILLTQSLAIKEIVISFT